MPHFFIKILKTSLWAIVPFFLISQGNPEQVSLVEVPHQGYYAFVVSGEVSENLDGIIHFETTKETSVGGSEYYVIRFNLKSKRENRPHRMEFSISKPCKKDKISAGTYQVAKPVDGFLNYFEGVFGAADFKRMDELPFFTDRGTIEIKSLDEHTIEGSMSVTLRDPNGKKIRIRGEFDALRQEH
ncbi:hypothetical protein K8352_12575 [Flavobacteriaceae bacterium F89]|uniref:Uncharacterized protein n=1 Tax=Cerina litoralis TaxID=2874477 RepID=A0AAE3EXM5_9FLAO|nr:hypothetical protein [Cerina litoralis]MCG2461587.1 hypothetical protein [Cerina litoralis]